VEYKEIYLPEGAPEYLKNRERLWNEVEQRETRKNSTVAREFEKLPLVFASLKLY
jgi:hypothetical protein